MTINVSVCKALNKNEQTDEYIVKTKQNPYREKQKGLPNDPMTQ